MSDNIFKEIASLLNQGGTLLYPSDTIYGLGCDALNLDAVEKIYQAKERPESMPCLALATDLEFLRPYFEMEEEEELLQKIWPGPFTVLFKPKTDQFKHLEGPTGKVGIRVGDHPWLSSLFEQWQGLLLSTSANTSGTEYKHDASYLTAQWSAKVDKCIFIDNYPGLNSSTLLDFDQGKWKILRQGAGILEDFLK